ncbi:exodeoxyribonuclease VII small subunit [Vulgatibacter incomptus]|uniref:Exodeoxyribonuclease 7 small subunit n=1 Tax=Vulgatibacter incomptus TaxID=1391653 RepID=A0A0K1PAT7_9BACT|nr:exodeoxyribonuclease VII small subunit [Vulgatibacter incomptus]AKU90640.1 Exodeoxyribonuclease VII small subunit [Vulgatibacter incomptus]
MPTNEEKRKDGADSLDDVAYEALIQELDSVVRQLEASELSLEESLQAFERGVKLSKAAEHRLDEAEGRVEVLLQGDRTRPLAQQESGEGPRSRTRSQESEEAP